MPVLVLIPSYKILHSKSFLPDDPIPFLAIGTFYFDQLSSYQNSFGPNAEKIRSDIPNYTNIQPEVLISEVVE